MKKNYNYMCIYTVGIFTVMWIYLKLCLQVYEKNKSHKYICIYNGRYLYSYMNIFTIKKEL